MTRPYRPMATPHERSVPTVVRMGAINVLVTRTSRALQGSVSVRSSIGRVINSRIPGWVLSEGAGAFERAEAVLDALVSEPARAVPGIDRHPADRIDRQAGGAARAQPDRRIHLDRLTDIAKCPASALP
jgi:hypothetical protein